MKSTCEKLTDCFFFFIVSAHRSFALCWCCVSIFKELKVQYHGRLQHQQKCELLKRVLKRTMARIEWDGGGGNGGVVIMLSLNVSFNEQSLSSCARVSRLNDSRKINNFASPSSSCHWKCYENTTYFIISYMWTHISRGPSLWNLFSSFRVIHAYNELKIRFWENGTEV